MSEDEGPVLDKLTGRQKRPATGDVFRVRFADSPYYFGLVVDGNMAVGPMAPGSILVTIFSGGSESGEIEDFDELVQRPLFMPPAIVNQRPWTLGYAERVGAVEQFPRRDYFFWRPSLRQHYTQHGDAVSPPQDDSEVGIWGLGNEQTLSAKMDLALTRGKPQ